MSWTKTSRKAFVSPATRFVEKLANAIQRPSEDITGRALQESPCAPDESTLARTVAPVQRSRTKTSVALFVSPATRFEAALWNAIQRPPEETTGKSESWFACAPAESRLARVVTWAARGAV